MIKFNCWEYFGCGREPHGRKAKTAGICRAATEPMADGINGGVKGGRICWAIVGTGTEGSQKCTAVEDGTICSSCDFFKLVREEEGVFGFRLFVDDEPDAEEAPPQPS